MRGSAALTLASLLDVAAATGNNSTEALTLWSKICNKLSELLCSEPVPELLIAYYTTLVESINVLAPNAVSGTQLQALSKAVNANMIEIYNRIKERDNAEDEYTEDVEEDEEEYTDEELLDEINKVIAVVLKNVKSNFLETLQILALQFLHS